MKTRLLQFDLLKIIMCFMVVLIHNDLRGLFQDLSVPCFMFMSFYFSAEAILNHDIDKIKKRIKRLLIPFYFWSILFYIGYYAASFVSDACARPTLRDLLMQLLTGFNEFSDFPLWYICALIILLIVLTTISYCAKSQSTYILITYAFIIPISLMLSYSGINYTFWVDRSYTYGTLCNMIIYAILGVTFYRFDLFNKFANVPSTLFSILTYMFIAKFDVIATPSKAFRYDGLKLIVLTCLVMIVFYNLPVQKLAEKIKSSIAFISKYIMGVFCIQWGFVFLINILKSKNIIAENKFLEAVVVFAVSWITSYIISLLPFKWCKQLVE